MKVTRFVDVLNALNDLVEYTGNKTASEVSTFSRFGELIEVAFHAFKDEVQLASVWFQERIVERNDGRMMRYLT